MSLEAVSIRVSKHINTRDIDAWRDQRVRLSYLRRDGRTRVTAPGEDLLPGDHVVMVGDPESIKETAPLVGEILDHNLEDDRSDLAFERIAANAAALHPFPEHNVALVRDALADAGFDITLLGPDAPEIGEGVYFQPEPFDDEVMGLLADALTLRGIGAYAYALVDSSLGGDLADIALFTRVGDMFPRHGRHILMTRMYIHRTPTGAGNKAVTWAFGSPADLEEANRLLSEKFDTEPVTDPRGMRRPPGRA